MPSSKEGPAASGPATFNEALLTELRELRPAEFDGIHAATFAENKSERAGNLRNLYREIGGLKEGLSALCFSGGGIRSATYNLGVIQALANMGLLDKFDYLSSVSGGGYIASWLRAWMRREGVQNVIDELAKPCAEADPLAPEPKPVDALREYSNYLTPKLGLFSADTWTAVAMVIRNLILNWLVILPLLGVIASLPQVFLLVAHSSGFGERPGWAFLFGSFAVALAASVTTYWFRRFVRSPKTPESHFVKYCALPIWASMALLCGAGLGIPLPWRHASPPPSQTDIANLMAFAAIWCIGIPVAGWVVSEFLPIARGKRAPMLSLFFEALGLVISGAVTGALLVAIVMSWFSYLYHHPALYVIFGFPILLGLYLLARVLFVAFASLGESWKGAVREGSSDDADREWWARLSGWVLLIGATWMVLSVLCLLGGDMLRRLEEFHMAHILAGVGGVSGLLAALTGLRGDSDSTNGKSGGLSSGLKNAIMGALAPVFAICAFVVIAWGTGLMGEHLTGHDNLMKLSNDLERTTDRVELSEHAIFLLLPIGLAVIALIMGRVVNVNRFSLHGFYRNRLVRAYLGASNRMREPDPFTGFAEDDNLKLHELWDPSRGAGRPVTLINASLNLVRSGDKLAWQQRKAESFSMTPFFCGNFHEGYRRSDEYGGPNGVSLGTAVTISGAAANPNMGSSSSAALGFLLALFNGRLGAWLGNTNKHGESTYRFPGPRQAIFPLFGEMFGLTSSEGKYISLSDGGHFENLGLYEVVLRRARFVVVSDAGHDPKASFEDLGNAIRKIRIDFAVPIEFTRKILILPRDKEGSGLYCATAIIRYQVVDGPGVPDGHLVYIKPTLLGSGEPIPYDVYSYAQASRDFPHESTADQWFSESQFESYRTLGSHAVRQVLGGAVVSSVEEFLQRSQEHLLSGESK